MNNQVIDPAAAPVPASSDGVVARVERGVGHLTLDRPRAINALDIGMVRRLAGALDAWERDPEVRAVVLDGAGERGLCAGGDVRELREQVLRGDAAATSRFFREEYALNARIAEYPLPLVVLADGVTMGGGIGLAGHAGVRIVTERSRLAMPETRIGFTPDVGGSWLLAHAPGRLGEYLALTGAAMDAADAIYAGFADHFVPSDQLDALRAAFQDPDQTRPREHVRRAVDGLGSNTPAPSRLEGARAWIDAAFAAPSVSEISERLRARSEPDAAATAQLLSELSPTALTVTLAAVRRARELPGLRAALAQEYGLVMWFAETQPDLAEGIRAQVVDKDRTPRWRPADLASLAPGIVDEAFAHVPAVPLWE